MIAQKYYSLSKYWKDSNLIKREEKLILVSHTIILEYLLWFDKHHTFSFVVDYEVFFYPRDITGRL